MARLGIIQRMHAIGTDDPSRALEIHDKANAVRL